MMEKTIMTFKIRFDYATYSQVEEIEAEDGEEAIAKGWRKLKPWLTLPMAYKNAVILEAK